MLSQQSYFSKLLFWFLLIGCWKMIVSRTESEKLPTIPASSRKLKIAATPSYLIPNGHLAVSSLDLRGMNRDAAINCSVHITACWCRKFCTSAPKARLEILKNLHNHYFQWIIASASWTRSLLLAFLAVMKLHTVRQLVVSSFSFLRSQLQISSC